MSVNVKLGNLLLSSSSESTIKRRFRCEIGDLELLVNMGILRSNVLPLGRPRSFASAFLCSFVRYCVQSFLRVRLTARHIPPSRILPPG